MPPTDVRCGDALEAMRFRRAWAMPDRHTFAMRPVRAFVRSYLLRSTVSVDPFAGEHPWATLTNDAAWPGGMEATTFLEKLRADGVRADLILLDPPYSPRQIAEHYAQHRPVTQSDTQIARMLREVRDLAASLLVSGGVVLSFGWNSNGMGRKRGFEIEEILLVAHGAAHNDTICLAERSLPIEEDAPLFNRTAP